MSRPVILFGGGGHGRVVHDALRLQGRTVVAVIDPGAPRFELTQGIEHVTDETAFLAAFDPASADVAIGIGATPQGSLRRDIHARLVSAGASFADIRHPSSILAGDALLGVGCQVLASAVVQSGARLGDDVTVNTGAIVEHDNVVGDHTHVAPGAVLLGDVAVGARSFIGGGSVIGQGVRVGNDVVVGMGATVLADVPDGLTITGAWRGE